MKRKFYSWEECMNLREVKVRMLMLWAGYGTLIAAVLPVKVSWEDNAVCNATAPSLLIFAFKILINYNLTHTLKCHTLK